MRHDQGGLAIPRLGAAVVLATFIFWVSAAAASPQTDFELSQSSGHAGELVHFSIAGMDGPVSYALKVADQELLAGGSADGLVSDSFTVPNLGDAARTVTVEVEVRGPRKHKKAKRRLEYLGLAVHATSPPASSPDPVVPAAAPDASTPQAPQSPPAASLGTSPAAAVGPPSTGLPQRGRGRRGSEPPRHAPGVDEDRRRTRQGRERSDRDARQGKRRSRHLVPRTAPLFDGVPEPGAGAFRDGAGGRPKIAPPKAALATGARVGDGGVSAAVMVPALVGLASLTLAGAAVLRRRRLASRRGD